MQDFPGCKALSSVTAAADTIMHADRISTNTIIVSIADSTFSNVSNVILIHKYRAIVL